MDLKDLLKKIKLSEQTISTILGGLVILVVGILIFNYFRSTGNKTGLQGANESTVVSPEKENAGITPEGLPTTYKVAKGDHLWAIAEKFYGSGYNWVDIAKENHLTNPNRIFVGQEIIIPKVESKKALVAAEKTKESISGTSYTVVKGDHLWGIAVRAYGDGYKWVEIAKANKLANPNIIHPGNVLTLPR